MKVYKFGGASVKDAEGVRNISQLLVNECTEPLVIVISAMGKTTNMLEKVVNDYYSNNSPNLVFCICQLIILVKYSTSTLFLVNFFP